MDETESMISGMSDDESTPASSKGEHAGGGGGVIITETNNLGVENQNGTDEMLNTALDDGVVDDDEEEEDEEDVMNPVTAASALSELVGSVGGVVGGLSSVMEANQNHHHQHHLQHHHQSPSLDTSCQPAPTRYLQVEGFDGRRNDIVYCSPLKSILRSACGNTNNHEESSSSTESSSNTSCSTESTTEVDAQSSSQKAGGGGEADENEKPKVILFFGGDIQDFPEMMEQHRDHRNYVQFNLEATALQIQKQFPEHHVAVVRPSRIQMLTFSCYDNFVHCNHTGAPEHVITHHSLHHLELLLQNLSKRIASNKEASTSSTRGAEDDGVDSVEDEGINVSKIQMNKTKDCGSTEGKSNCNNSNNTDEDSTVSSTTVDESSSSTSSSIRGGDASSTPTEGGGRQCNNSSSTNGSSSKISNKKSLKSKTSAKIVRLDRAWISLVGFSKGCVVLNQLLYEFHYLKTLTPDDLSMDDFLHCIKDMYWLDGGHNGGKNTWITSRSLLETLTRLGVTIHVHLTPYQLLDDRRPWIRKEEKLFSDLLKKFSAPIVRQIHFENEPPSLQQHLRIIGDFNTHPLRPQQHHQQQQQQLSLLHRGVDDDIDGGVMEGEENHKQVNVVVGGGESGGSMNDMD